jgi:hypothetical protein
MLEIVLPFGLPPGELAKDLIGQLKLPNLTRLLSRAEPCQSEPSAPYAAQLPHEAWLARRLGPAHLNACGLAQRLNLTPAAGHWFIIAPIHLHIARDHLVLTDQRQLNLSPEHARALFELAASCFAEAGLELVYGDTRQWLLRADAWGDLQTASLDAACGHNIDIWLPKGQMARAWRKLQNEVQMVWFEHPANLARQELGLPPVNSIWLGGGCALPDPATPGPTKAPAPRLLPAAWHGQPFDAAQDAILYLDQLIGPALAADWSEWLHRFAELDQTSLVAALTQKQCTLVLSHSLAQRSWLCRQSNSWRFWHKPGLAPLLP